jgi:uncharacterized Zn-finger protein
MTRKAFQPLPDNENPQFIIDGTNLYHELKNKYPNNTNEDLDNILNGLCAALICLMYGHVEKDNRKQFLQLVYTILNKNLN